MVDLVAPDHHLVTGLWEHDGVLWLGSLHEPAVARSSVSDLPMATLSG